MWLDTEQNLSDARDEAVEAVLIGRKGERRERQVEEVDGGLHPLHQHEAPQNGHRQQCERAIVAACGNIRIIYLRIHLY